MWSLAFDAAFPLMAMKVPLPVFIRQAALPKRATLNFYVDLFQLDSEVVELRGRSVRLGWAQSRESLELNARSP